MNYFVELRGGLGDVMMRFLLRWSDSGLIPSLRLEDPEASVQLLVMSTAPAAARDFFAECELFDQIVFATWDGDPAAFAARHAAGRHRVYREGLTWTRPDIGLTASERATAGSIEARPFIAVHPFAGTPDRDWRGHFDLDAVIDGLAALGVGVVVLGGNSARTHGRRGTVQTVELEESLPSDQRGAISLVGASVRLQAYLATRASFFVGSFSAFHCAALATGVPACIVAPRDLGPFFATQHPIYGRLDARPHSRIVYFDQQPSAVVEAARRAIRERAPA